MIFSINNFMKPITIEGLELWEDIATTLNRKVANPTGLTINDKEIWNNYLHRWNNREWLILLAQIERLYHLHPEYFDPGHKAIVDECLQLIQQHGDTEPRVMDLNRNGLHHKGSAWRAICSFREIWNNVNDIELPNSVTTRNKS
jgi:hypothetical protein